MPASHRNLQEFIARGWVKKDEAPSYYIYAQRMGDHLQVRMSMFVCCRWCTVASLRWLRSCIRVGMPMFGKFIIHGHSIDHNSMGYVEQCQ